MNVKRFTARNSREALTLVRQALGEDAVVLSTKPCPEGVEVLAMAPDGMRQIEQAARHAPNVRAANIDEPVDDEAPAPPATPAPRRAAAPAAARPARTEPRFDAAPSLRPERIEPRFDDSPVAPVEADVERLAMSTLSFQDYVRERMLKRRQSELDNAAQAAVPPRSETPSTTPAAPALRPPAPPRAAEAATLQRPAATPPRARRDPPVLRDEIRLDEPAAQRADPGAAQRDRTDMMNELRSMKGLIEERFGALAFMEKMQRNPRQAGLSQKLLDTGFSPALIRKLVDGLPVDAADENAWAASVLERNLLTDEHEQAMEDTGGIFALIGSTGVGKTTSTAKIAAAFATKFGASHLGLVTLDAYRVGAHEQLRTYGRILGVPVHTAHDRASLEDLLDLLSAKKMVLIDTAGMAQRDSRTRELLEMIGHRAIQKLLVVNAAAQGETIEDVVVSYRASQCRGVVLSKLDEAVKLGPALDALIRHKLKVVGVANGQRVPEDWHRLSAQALVHRALRGGGSASWKLDAADVNLLFAAVQHAGPAAAARAGA